MVHLNELPPCLLVDILSFLPISEVIRLKLVCKAWQELSYFVRFKSLRLYRYDYEGVYEDSLIEPERFPERFDVYVNDFERFFQSTSSMVRGVQHLAVCLFDHPINYENNRLENFLHRFRMLEELELRVLGYVTFRREPGPQFNLKFERLRKLQLRYRHRSVKINCPELIYLDFAESDETNCQIRYPEKLRTLVVDRAYDKKNFKKFVNLKNLVIDLFRGYGESTSFNERFLAGLPKSLKRLIFSECGFCHGEYSNRYDLEEHLRESYAADQENLSLRIFYRGIELSRSRFKENAEKQPFPSYYHSKENSEFMITNLANSVDANIFLDHVDYNVIEKHLPSFDLLYKKMHWNDAHFVVTVSESVADPDRLLELIEKLKPSCLEFEHPAVFPRQFFDRLVEIASKSITSLNFDAVNLREPNALDFLLKMTQLCEVVVSDWPALTFTECIDLMIAALEKIKTLSFFAFFWASSSFDFNQLDFSLNFYYTDEEGARRDISYKFGKYNQNGLDVLKCLNARMKQSNLLKKRNADQFTSEALEFFSLLEEFKKEAQFNQLAFDVIVDVTKSQEVDLDLKLETLKMDNFDLYEFDEFD